MMLAKRLLSGMLSILLAVTSQTGLLPITRKEARAEKRILSNPRIVSDRGMKTGQKVTWDCIWFGSYPQAEVVPASKKYRSVAKELLESGDVIYNDSLYQTLRRAAGWDKMGNISINGGRYRRIKKSDAEYISPEDGHYKWSSGGGYHYFKYQPVKWRVLSVSGSKAFLLADKALNIKQYHTAVGAITWENSTLRSWLNGYGAYENDQGKDYRQINFINDAFSSVQRFSIMDTHVKNQDNLLNGAEGGSDTVDKVFLLSESEVCTGAATSYGFVSDGNTYDEARRTKSTLYAKAMGTYSYTGDCWWWLRSPQGGSTNAERVDSFGKVSRNDYDDFNPYDSVRPALNLNLASITGSSNVWSYAGTVCSDGTVKNYQSNPSLNIKRGFKVTDKKTKAVYRITSTGKNRTVEFVKSTKKNLSTVTIPDVVKVKGKIYKVTSIGKRACKGSKRLRMVKIGKHVKTIGREAFYRCKKLRYILVKTKKLTAKILEAVRSARGLRGFGSRRIKASGRRMPRFLGRRECPARQCLSLIL